MGFNTHDVCKGLACFMPSLECKKIIKEELWLQAWGLNFSQSIKQREEAHTSKHSAEGRRGCSNVVAHGFQCGMLLLLARISQCLHYVKDWFLINWSNFYSCFVYSFVASNDFVFCVNQALKEGTSWLGWLPD